MNKCKGIVVLAIAIILLSACNQQVVFRPLNESGLFVQRLVLEESSYFSGLHIQNGCVYFDCVLIISNCSETDVCFSLEAAFPDDIGALVVEGQLPGYFISIDNPNNSFPIYDPSTLQETKCIISPGTHLLNVVFAGTHAGGEKKANRLLPWIYYTVERQSGSTG